MRRFAAIVSFLALLILLLPNLGAQDKKDPAKADNKEVDKKDPEKKDAAKDNVKKETKKEVKKEPEEKVVWGDVIKGAKFKRMDANSAGVFTIEVSQVDPKKVDQLNNWKINEMTRIMNIPLKEAQRRAQDMARFQMQLAQKQTTDIYTMKDKDLRTAENFKVRTLAAPVQYDDKGRVKTLTPKELKALKGNSKLPGYPAEMDDLKTGQIVTVYLAKTKAPAKGESAAPKKKNDDDGAAKPEAVMIVVEKEAPVN